jgi:hypothetical protein
MVAPGVSLHQVTPPVPVLVVVVVALLLVLAVSLLVRVLVPVVVTPSTATTRFSGRCQSSSLSRHPSACPPSPLGFAARLPPLSPLPPLAPLSLVRPPRPQLQRCLRSHRPPLHHTPQLHLLA